MVVLLVHSKNRVSGWHSSVIEVQVPATAKRILHEFIYKQEIW